MFDYLSTLISRRAYGIHGLYSSLFGFIVGLYRSVHKGKGPVDARSSGIWFCEAQMCPPQCVRYTELGIIRLCHRLGWSFFLNQCAKWQWTWGLSRRCCGFRDAGLICPMSGASEILSFENQLVRWEMALILMVFDCSYDRKFGGASNERTA